VAKVRPGQRFRPQASLWNSFIDSLASRGGGQAASQYGDLAPGVVWIRNDSGANRSRFEILGLGAPIWSPTDNLTAFKNSLEFQGESPTFADYFGKFVVLLESIPSGRIGRGLVQGVCNVQVDVQDADHEYADLNGTATDTLRSFTAGSARILWKESGTGDKWARVLLGNQAVKLWRFTMNEAFSGSPTSADCDLLNIDGSDTGQDVDVYDRLDIAKDDLENGDPGWCVQMGSTFHFIQAPCHVA